MRIARILALCLALTACAPASHRASSDDLNPRPGEPFWFVKKVTAPLRESSGGIVKHVQYRMILEHDVYGGFPFHKPSERVELSCDVYPPNPEQCNLAKLTPDVNGVVTLRYLDDGDVIVQVRRWDQDGNQPVGFTDR